MFNYRVVRTGDCEIELQSFTKGGPTVHPVWECNKYIVSQVYCVLQLKDGRCIVTLDQWRDDAILFVGFFVTNAHGYIHKMLVKENGWTKFDPPIPLAEDANKEKASHSSSPPHHPV